MGWLDLMTGTDMEGLFCAGLFSCKALLLIFRGSNTEIKNTYETHVRHMQNMCHMPGTMPIKLLVKFYPILM